MRRVRAVVLRAIVGGRGLRLVRHPRPEVVYPRIERVFACVLDDQLAGDLGVPTAAVLVGPLDGQDTSFVVVHALALGECRRVLVDERVLVLFVLHVFVAYSTITCIAALGIVLTVEKSVRIVAIHIALAVSVCTT